MSDGMEVVLQCKFCPHFVPYGEGEDAAELARDLFHNHIMTSHPEYLYKLEEE